MALNKKFQKQAQTILFAIWLFEFLKLAKYKLQVKKVRASENFTGQSSWEKRCMAQ